MRKQVNPESSEVLQPNYTGRKATMEMDVKIYIEVRESDDYNEMVRQAKAQLQQRVVEGRGFFPFRSSAVRCYPDVEVMEIKAHTVVDRKGRW